MRKRKMFYFSKSFFHSSKGVMILITLCILVSLAACKSPNTISQTPNGPTGQTTTKPSPGVTTEAEPIETLSICMAEEPQSLYLYDGRLSGAKMNVLAAIYDGPIDHENLLLSPVILESVPTFENGALTLEPVVVNPGQYVIDATGEIRAFREGVLVRPAGCQQSDCAITWDGSGEFTMDMMVMTFTLVDGLTWSDGVPLKASDSVYSYAIASDKATPGTRWAIDRTAEYHAPDQKTIIWKGLPGFITPEVDLFYWSPLPEHIWSDLSATQLLEDPRSNKSPLGWGAYQISNWLPGEQLELETNPYYFRADEGLPYFDRLIYKFIPDTDSALSALESGECDILDESYALEARLGELLVGEDEKLYDVQVATTSIWEGLVFGITPASYDDGYTPIYGDRPDYFGDPRTRQAFAYCIDRQRIVNEVLWGLSEVPQGLTTITNPLLETEPTAFMHDPTLGNQLLDQVGWKDVDATPGAPRQAWGINGITSGTPFEVVLLMSPSVFHYAAAQIITDSLAECGVQVTQETLQSQDLFAPGPQGPLFGRQFDLALFSWNSNGRNDCMLYQSWQTPGKNNYWIGTNLGGFSSQAFDQICNDAKLSLKMAQDNPNTLGALQNVFLDQWPVIPIAYGLDVLLSRNDIMGVVNTPFSPSNFNHLEEFFKINP